MFTFISYWRTAAVVLCDLASTAYYIGGIVEGAIGAAAPWFILAVMLFSYAVRSIYIESCSLFVRGGVYRVVKEAMGGFLAKLSVSALMFDYILTGPVSGVSAGQYIMGLLIDAVRYADPQFLGAAGSADAFRRWGAVIIAVAITLYFFRQNLVGLHESSGKALRIMIATTIMGVVMLVWCGVTLWMRGGPVNPLPALPNLAPKVEYREVTGAKDRLTGAVNPSMWLRDPRTGRLEPEKITAADGRQIDKPKINEATGPAGGPLGPDRAAGFPGLAARLRAPGNWWSIVGLVGILLAFGHSILAMSGEETLAQVYREVESPKLKNFKKAAFIVFVYSLALTAGISFLAVMLIPDEVRMKVYSDNLIGGLAMYVWGPLRGPPGPERLRRGRGVPDPGRGGQYGHHRFQRRLEPRGRRRRHARLVPQAPPPLRHHLPRAVPDRGPATADHPAQPGRHVRAGRGLRLRRGMELRLQGPGHDRAPLPATEVRASSRCR